MAFPTEFPKDAVAILLHPQDKDTALIALATYDLVGFGLHLYFGDPKYAAGLSFDLLNKIAVGADTLTKVQTRAVQLKGSGLGVAAILLQLLLEFGPSILTLVAQIRELLNPTPTPALPA